MSSSPPTSRRFAFNYRPQLARSGLKNSPLPNLPSWLRLNAIPSFDYSPDSDLSATSSAHSAEPQLPTLHPAQQQIYDSRQRFNVLALGRRTGKTTLAQRVLAETALGGEPGGYFAPTYKLLEDFWREFKLALRDQTSSKSEQQHRLELEGGGTIDCWSMDTGDPARGRKYRRVVIDEAAMVPHLSDIWALAIRPTLTDYQGDAWFMSTPRGLNDFFHLYQRGQDPLESGWRAWQMPTSVNPYIEPQEIQDARHDLTEREFSQEYLAQFLTIGGAGVFRGVQSVARLEAAPPARGHTYVMGVDWARSNDFTVISVIDATLSEQVALDRFSNIDFEYQAERVHRWAELYHPVQIVAEANSMGGPLVERLQTGYARLLGKPRAALPIYAWTATNASKAAVVQALALAIEQGDVTLLDDQVQTAELLAFESSVTVTGMVRYSAPSGQHDDTVMGLALAYLGSQLATAAQPRSSYRFAGRH